MDSGFINIEGSVPCGVNNIYSIPCKVFCFGAPEDADMVRSPPFLNVVKVAALSVSSAVVSIPAVKVSVRAAGISISVQLRSSNAAKSSMCLC